MDVLGQLDGATAEVLGDILGAAAAAVQQQRGGHRGGMIRLPPKPSWRQGQVAPGVQAPGTGAVPLPMLAQTNGGTFTATIPAITWIGRVQKPYAGTRLLVSSSRIGATAAAPRLIGQIFVGTDLQQAQIAGYDIELLGAPTSFDTGIELVQAEPGVDVTMPVVLSSGLTAPDTIFVSILFRGYWVH